MSEPAPAPTLQGLQIAITGRLASMTREDAIAAIEARGGHYVDVPNERTDRLVVGLEGWALQRDGRPTRSLERAHDLQRDGRAIRIQDEAEFLNEAGLADQAHALSGLYTIEQLSRMLCVPRAKLRGWVNKGLIRPERVVRRLCWFDFAQVAGAKALQQLLDKGATIGAIRRGLQQVADWLPRSASRPLLHLDALARGSQLVLRLDDGKLVEPSGQLHFEFADAASKPSPAAGLGTYAERRRSPQDWFGLGIAAEDDGRLEDAADAYHQALLAGGPQPEVAFNLGNVLHGLGRPGEAAQRFMMAVEIDPEYVEAWNNLGNVLAELGRNDASIRAYRKALETEPMYADAHFNLAETLQHLGRYADARTHWLAYLRQSSEPRDSTYVRRMISECERLATRFDD